MICHNVSEEISITQTSVGGGARAEGVGADPPILSEQGEEGEWLLGESFQGKEIYMNVFPHSRCSCCEKMTASVTYCNY